MTPEQQAALDRARAIQRAQAARQQAQQPQQTVEQATREFNQKRTEASAYPSPTTDRALSERVQLYEQMQAANAPAEALQRLRVEIAGLRSRQVEEGGQTLTQSPSMRSQVRPEDQQGLGYRLRDNIIGIDDGFMSPGEQAAALLNEAGESATLGLVGDETAGRFDEVIGRRPVGEGVQFYRDQEEQLREVSPAMATAAEFAGGFMGAAKVAAPVRATTQGARRWVAGGLSGGAAGGTYAAMEEDGDLSGRRSAALWGGLVGAGFGAIAPGAVDIVRSLPARVRGTFERAAERPTVERLMQAKNAAYQAVEDAREVFSGDDMRALSTQVRQAFDDGNAVLEEDGALRAALKTFERREGQETTLSQLDRIRQRLFDRYNANLDQPQILDAISAIDDLIEQRAATSAAMSVAREANRLYSNSRLLQSAFQKAADQTASTGSGGNILNKYRQAVTAIINDPRRARFFRDSEVQTMREFVHGRPSENILRLIGKMSPEGNGLMMVLQTVGGVATQGATLPLMVAGAGAKRAADRMVESGAGRLQDMAAGFTRPAAPRLSRQNFNALVGSAPAIEEQRQNALR